MWQSRPGSGYAWVDWPRVACGETPQPHFASHRFAIFYKLSCRARAAAAQQQERPAEEEAEAGRRLRDDANFVEDEPESFRIGLEGEVSDQEPINAATRSKDYHLEWNLDGPGRVDLHAVGFRAVDRLRTKFHDHEAGSLHLRDVELE
jgi:hypothetical protein